MRCGGCGVTAYPADDRIGLGGFLSPGATRLACLAAASWSFDVASDRLEELAGVRLDDETIRRHVHRAAGPVRRRREAAPPAAFVGAGGDVEFLADGVMVPSRDGWRELKLATFQARPRGAAADVAAWADRDVPAPATCAAYAALCDAESFAARWRPWAEGLGIDPDGELTVLADGAAWIWAAAGACFPAAAQVLDIFHASGYVATAAAGLHGEGTPGAAEWGWSGAGPDSWPTAGRGCSTTSAPRRRRDGQRPPRRRWTR